jgi:hypothetical protein
MGLISVGPGLKVNEDDVLFIYGHKVQFRDGRTVEIRPSEPKSEENKITETILVKRIGETHVGYDEWFNSVVGKIINRSIAYLIEQPDGQLARVIELINDKE